MSRARERVLMDRRHALVAESAMLREQIAGHARELKQPFRVADRLSEAVRWVKANPLWPVAALGIFVVFRPRMIVGWGVRAFGAWRLWRRLRPLTGPLLRRLLER